MGSQTVGHNLATEGPEKCRDWVETSALGVTIYQKMALMSGDGYLFISFDVIFSFQWRLCYFNLLGQKYSVTQVSKFAQWIL